MANKFLDLVGLSHFKDLMVQFVTSAITALSTTVQETYSTKTEVSGVNDKSQGVLDAFAQFNSENEIS